MMKPMLAGIAAALVAAGGAGAVTRDNFQLRDGADLVALCTVSEDDPLHAEAIHLCHGFAVGTYRTIMALTHYKNLEPLFCPPNPGPTRNEGIAAFVEWAAKNPQYQGDSPEEYVGRFLIVSLPCPKPSAAAGSSAQP